MRLLLLLFAIVSSLIADGFVEEVTCSAESLMVVLNQTDPDLAAWLANPASQPVLYVYNHKERRECGTSLKNENGEINYNLTIGYGKQCDVHLTDIEPNYRTAETTVVLEDETDQNTVKTTRINHVFCLYTRKVQTIRFSDVRTGDEVVASTGGKPMPKVEMLFRSGDGRGNTLRAAKFGDSIEFYVALTPDAAYKGISPKECVFSDREDFNTGDAQKLTFVQNGCPLLGVKNIIPPLGNVNSEVYFSKFKTFRFGDKSTVFAHCTVQVCLDANDKECHQDCFEKINNSNLSLDRLRFRHRRATVSGNVTGDGNFAEVTLKGQLTVLNGNETQEVTSRSLEQCLTPGQAPFHLVIILSALTLGLCLSTTISFILCCRLKKGKRESFEVYGTYNNTAVLPSAYRY